MSILVDLEEFRELLINAKKAAFSKTILIPEHEARDLLEKIIRDFPSEFEEASEVVKNRDLIIRQAVEEAESIKLNADERAKIIKKANEEAQAIIENAKLEAIAIIEVTKVETEKLKDEAKGFIQKLIEQTLGHLRRSESILEESIEGIRNADI